MKIINLFNEFDRLIHANSLIFKEENINHRIDELFIVLPYYKVYEININVVMRIICFLVDNYEKLNDVNKLKLETFLENIGYYAHKHMPNINQKNIIIETLMIFLEFEGKFLTFQQKKLLDCLSDFYDNFEKKAFFFSAPTSFGKTMLVINSIKKNIENNNNIMFVLPKKTLINEIESELKLNYASICENITSIPLSFIKNFSYNKSNIFIGTQERYIAINSMDNSIKFDIIIVDEAHLIKSYIDERSRILLLLIKDNLRSAKFIFMSPNVYVESIRNNLVDMDIIFNNEVLKEFENDLIAHSTMCFRYVKKQNKYKIYSLENPEYIYYQNDNIDLIGENDLGTKKNILNHIIKHYPEYENKTIVYTVSPKEVIELAKSIKKSNFKYKKSKYYSMLELYLIDNYPENYFVLTLLRKGIVISISLLDDITRRLSIELFKKDKNINFLVANSTIDEGINLNANNLIWIVYKCNKSINKLVRNNVLGRVGRFGQKFLGNRLIIDFTDKGSKVVEELKRELANSDAMSNIEKSDIIIDSDFKDTISIDGRFSDQFLDDNRIDKSTRVNIPLSQYSYPSHIYKAIEIYIESLPIVVLKEYISNFFTFNTIKFILDKFKQLLKDEKLEELFYKRDTNSNSTHLALLYIDYLSGKNIKSIIGKEFEFGCMDKNGQLYSKTVRLDKNKKNLNVYTEKYQIDKINEDIQKILIEMNHYCGYSIKKY